MPGLNQDQLLGMAKNIEAGIEFKESELEENEEKIAEFKEIMREDEEDNRQKESERSSVNKSLQECQKILDLTPRLSEENRELLQSKIAHLRSVLSALLIKPTNGLSPYQERVDLLEEENRALRASITLDTTKANECRIEARKMGLQTIKTELKGLQPNENMGSNEVLVDDPHKKSP